MNQANQMNQLKQVNQMNQVKQENLVDLAIQAKLLKNYFIQIRFIFAPFQTDPNLHSVFSG